MAIEAIKGAGMSFQGSSSTAAVKSETAAKIESASTENTSNEIMQQTTTISTKETSGDGAGSGNEGSNPQFANQNAQIKKAVEEINKKAFNSEAVFGIHDATNRVTIKIVDKETKEVLKEYPPEKTLDMIAKVWEMAGLLVDEKR